MASHLVSLTLAAILTVAPGLALAAGQKPDIAVKTRFAEASVSLDPAIRSNAALTENLLSEGKRWLERNRADAAKQYRASPELFRDGRAYTFERNYRQSSKIADRYISVIRTDYIYTGGAHPNADIDTILWDDKSKKQISIRPFFKETADNGPTLRLLRSAAIEALKAEKKTRGIDDAETNADDWYKWIEPRLLKVGSVSLASSTIAGKSAGLDFHYPPYAVGPYAEGTYVVFVPWESFKNALSPEGAAIFAGTRPDEAKTGDK